MKSKVKSIDAMFSNEALAAARYSKGQFNVESFPIIPNNTIMYLSWFRRIKFEVKHLEGAKAKTPSEIQLTSYLKEVERKIKAKQIYDQDRTFHMSEEEALAYKSMVNRAYARYDVDMLKSLQLYPFNIMDISPLIIIYDKDCVWKDISDLMMEYGTNVYDLDFVRGNGYFNLSNIPNPDQEAEFELFLKQLCNLLSSKSHEVTWVSRDLDTTETDIAKDE